MRHTTLATNMNITLLRLLVFFAKTFKMSLLTRPLSFLPWTVQAWYKLAVKWNTNGWVHGLLELKVAPRSIFFPDFKIRLRFFWIFPCHRSWFCLPNWMFSGLTLQYIAASLFPLVVPYRLITLYRVHRVFSTLAVTKISVIEYYPCHNTSNILHTYNKYNNPKGCLKYFEWKSNSC